jgi:hypothetical protein
MIYVDCENYVFDQMVSAIDRCIDCNRLHSSITVENVFKKKSNGIPIFHFTDIEGIRSSKSNVIIIDLITEGYNKFKFFINYPQDKKYIFFSNGWWNKEKYPLNFDYEILYWNHLLYDCVKRSTDSCMVDFFQDQIYDFASNKQFEFTALIGDKRAWRDKLTSNLLKNVKFENYILNYHGVEMKAKSRQLDIAYEFANYSRSRVLHQHYTIAQSIPIKMFNNSKILLVVETTMYDHDEFHLTEKTVKALLTGIPFVLAGSAGFLRHLKSLGFKTYNEVWSEEYDSILSVDDRINKIIDTLNHINSMPWNKTVIDKCQQIAYHNKQQLLNVNSIMKQQILTVIEQFKNYEI